ncbi:MAG: hypothetical protein H0T57_12080 [Rubrobacter sp.]|nr:hypothetical protein [Rubrobacter sp.]
MPRTATSPPTDGRLWRLLLARTHPDAGGTDELFVWAQALREILEDGPPDRQVCGRCNPGSSSPTEESDRIPFEPDLDPIALARRILALVDELEHPYSAVLRLLANCAPATHGRPQLQEAEPESDTMFACLLRALVYSESKIHALAEEWCAEFGRDAGEVWQNVWTPGPDNDKEGRG